MDPKKQLEDATLRNEDGDIVGIIAKGPSGNVVKLRPGSVTLGADVDRGLFLNGLKEGWSLQSAKGYNAGAVPVTAPAAAEPAPKK